MEFHLVPLEGNESNTGLSSLLGVANKKTEKIMVHSIRMDKFLSDNNIEKVDFLKLDAEGVNFEVLEGFGNRLKDVNAIHVEAEHTYYYWKNKQFSDIERILRNNEFEMVYFQRYTSQSDSFWIQKRFLKINRKEPGGYSN